MTDFRQVTQEELELVRSCGPDERCIVYDDRFIKLPIARILAMHEVAFKVAYTDALRLAEVEDADQLVSCELDDIEVGQTFLRVTVTDKQGRRTSAVGMLPDPRAQ
jgi:hypothetical protein